MSNLPADTTELRIRPDINGSDSGNVVRTYHPKKFAQNQSFTVKGLTLYAVLKQVTALKEELHICEERVQAHGTKLLVAHTFFARVDSMETEIEKLQKGLDVLKTYNASLHLQTKKQATDLAKFHARIPDDQLALDSKKLPKHLKDVERGGYQELLLRLDEFTASSEEARTLIDQVDTSHRSYHPEHYEASSSNCKDPAVNNLDSLDLVLASTTRLSNMPNISMALAEEALNVIDVHAITSTPPNIQTPTLPSKVGEAYCLGMYQNHSNALPGPAEAEELTISTLESKATSTDPSRQVMKKIPASKSELVKSLPDIPAPSTAFIQNVDAEMAPVADENVGAINQSLPPSPSDPYFISALSTWFIETESEADTAGEEQKRILEEKNSELKFQKTAPAAPQTVRLVLQSLVNYWIGAVLRTWERFPELRVAVLFWGGFGVAWILLMKAW